MFIKRKEYAESINKIHDEIRSIRSRIGKLEFMEGNPPKYSIGETFGNWKINSVFIDNEIRYPYLPSNSYFVLKYTCINCRDNKIKDFMEEELSKLK